MVRLDVAAEIGDEMLVARSGEQLAKLSAPDDQPDEHDEAHEEEEEEDDEEDDDDVVVEEDIDEAGEPVELEELR